MRKIICLVLSFAMVVSLTACGGKKTEAPTTQSTQPSVASPEATAPQQSGFASGEPIMVKMADGSEKTATLVNGFYQFETNSPVKVLELAYLHDQPSVGAAKLKLVYEGDAQDTIAFLVPKHIAHGNYQTAWENADSVIYDESFNDERIYGTDGEWAMPSNFWDYEVRIFNDYQSEAPGELAFIPLAAQTEVKIGELTQLKTASSLKVNGLTLDKTEYKVGENVQIVGNLDAEGFGDEAWIGIVPSGVPHGDDERNDTYDSDYEYLSVLENGKFALTIPELAGTYDLRINDGAVEIAYISIVVK